MARYRMQAPDGNYYSVEGPEGATDEEVRAEIIKQNPHLANEEPGFQDFDPTDEEGTRKRVFGPGPMMDIRETVGGLTLGASNELGSLMAASGAHIDGVAPEDESFMDTYRDIRDTVKGQQDEYREENPGRAFAHEMVGAAMIPDPTDALKVIPAVKRGVGALSKWRAGRGQTDLQRTLSRMDERVPSRLEHMVPDGPARGRLSKAMDTRTGRLTTRGALEGGIAGFFENDEDRLGGLIGGATAGAGAGLGFGGAGRLIKGPANRRIAQDLNRGEDHVPYPAARGDESLVATLYSDLVGRGIGGKKILSKQYNRWVGPAATRLNRAVNQYGKVSQNVRDTRAADNQLIDEAVEEMRLTGNRKLAEATEQAKNQMDETLTERIDSNSKNLRQQATKNSLNPNMSQKEADQILGSDVHTATDLLDTWWTNNAFKGIKGRSYQLTDDFRATLEDLSERYPELGAMIGKLDGRRKKITGKRLMNVRNTFARLANDRPDDRWAAGNARRIRKDLDDFVNDQLDDDGRKIFRQELDAWSVKEARYEAVKAASADRMGLFDADDWMNSLGLKGRLREYGKGPLQSSAQWQQGAKTRLTDSTSELKKARDKRAARDKEKQGSLLKKAKRAMRQRAEYMDRDKKSVRLYEAIEGKEKTADELASLIKTAPPETVSGLGQILSTQILSPLMATTGGGRSGGFIANVLGGLATGAGVASKPMQRFFAGQTTYHNLKRTLGGIPDLLPEERNALVRAAAQLQEAGMPVAEAATRIFARLEGMEQGKENQ